jgi:hypothetical protein
VRQAVDVPPRGSVNPPLTLALALLALVLLGAVVAVVALISAGPRGGVALVYAFPALAALYVAAGVLAWWRRPANRLGALLVCGGTSVLVASLVHTDVPFLIAVATVTATVPLAVIVHLLHASPTGRVLGRASRATVALAYVVSIVLQVPLWAFGPAPPPYDVVLVSPRPELALAGYRVQQVAGVVVVALTVGVLVRRLRGTTRRSVGFWRRCWATACWPCSPSRSWPTCWGRCSASSTRSRRCRRRPWPACRSPSCSWSCAAASPGR